MFNGVPIDRAIFSAKTRSLDVFSLRGAYALKLSVLGDHIGGMKRVKESRQQKIKIWRSFLLSLDPWRTQHQPGIEPQRPLGQSKDPLSSASIISRGY